MDWTTEDIWFDFLQRQEAFLYSNVTRRAVGPTQQGNGGYFAGDKVTNLQS
jgi:hypothetical protein